MSIDSGLTRHWRAWAAGAVCAMATLTTPAQTVSTGLAPEMEADMQAIMQMESEGQYADALAGLKALDRRTPGIFTVRLEMASAHYGLGEYDKAIGILKDLENAEEANAIVFQLEGNAFDMIGRRKDAIRLYETGLQRFPSSAGLLLEMGVCAESDNDFDKAIALYEKGIEAEPLHPSCYYRAARLRTLTGDRGTGMAYAEIFRLLEPHSERSKEMSVSIFQIHNEAIKLKDGKLQTDFGQSVQIIDGHMQPSFSSLYGFAARGTHDINAMTASGSISIADITLIRETVLKTLTSAKGYVFGKPIRALLKYQRQIADAGLWRAYCMWLMMYADMNAMQQWMATCEAKDIERFAEWYEHNPFNINQ